MTTDDQKAMTYRELRDRMATFTDEQLAMPVQWWGEERGGTVNRLDVLTEEFVTLDDRDPMEPRSVVEASCEPFTEDEIEARMAKGTPILAVD